MNTVMGFDFGLARIGVAIGSFSSRQAQAVTVLQAKNGCPDWNQLRKLVEIWRPSVFVIGDLPHDQNASFRRNPASLRLTKKMRAFRASLQKRFRLPTELIDESYSSHEARHLLREQRRSGRSARVRKGEIDMVAAVIILQSWLLQANPEKTIRKITHDENPHHPGKAVA